LKEIHKPNDLNLVVMKKLVLMSEDKNN